ncbi:MAG: GC-type dockerin domain-anchored protein [Phycisphaerales bacterium]|nr:GC-type dockerin domain-anchored protein [Phycisphaerales bacterium]
MRGLRVLIGVMMALSVRAAWAITIRVPEHFETIQEAIDFARGGDVIIVSDGVWSGPGNVDLRFSGKPITLRSENGPVACTIDAQMASSIIVFDGGELASTRVEGFTLTGGFGATGGAIQVAPGSAPTLVGCVFTGNTATGDGGAISVANGEMTITDCTFTGNSALRGGAASNAFGLVMFDGCTFDGNTATLGGGAVFGGANCSMSFAGCGFDANVAGESGGAVQNSGFGFLALTECSFTGNSAGVSGGSIANNGIVQTLDACTFTGERAGVGDGGAIMHAGDALPVLNSVFIDCASSFGRGGAIASTGDGLTIEGTHFEDCASDGSGGAIYAAGLGVLDSSFLRCVSGDDGGAISTSDLLTARRVAIFDGEAADLGGAIHNGGPQAEIEGCVIAGNRAARGGGIWNGVGSTSYGVRTCTIVHNAASVAGGGVYQNAGSISIANSILYFNAAPSGAQIGMQLGSGAQGQNCCVQGGLSTPGGQNISLNPMLMDDVGVDGVPGTGDEDLRISIASPCIDAGSNTQVLGSDLVDFAGDPRVVDGNCDGVARVDIGAFEVSDDAPVQAVLYVDASASLGGDGLTWETALVDLQSAIRRAACSGGIVEEIHVAQGTYTPDTGAGQTPGDRNASFRLRSGLRILGGYPGGSVEPGSRGTLAYPTILSGDLGRNDDSGVRTDNSARVVVADAVDASAVLDGFIIEGGVQTGPSGSGAGVRMVGGSPTLSNLVVRGNAAAFGAGVYVQGGSPTLANVLVHGNLADFGAGIAALGGASVSIVNATIVENTANFSGAGVYTSGGSANVANSIVWDNFPDAILGSVTTRYSIVTGGAPGTANLGTNPVFFDADAGDFSLAAGSPAIDSGENASIPAGIDTDLAGQARRSDDPSRADTGSGTSPVVDRGAFEVQGVAPCLADWDNSGGQPNSSDFLAYLNDFANQLPAADLAPPGGNGVFDSSDFLAYLNAYASGC